MARYGDWMQTFSGQAFYPLDPRPADIMIEDIAHALGNLCRFNGHCTDFYSVAQHSVMVASLVQDRLAMTALLHDASEAYLSDMPRPLKRGSEIGRLYRDAEYRMERTIAARFGLVFPWPAPVREADERMLATECRDLMGGETGGRWGLLAAPISEVIIPLQPRDAIDLFTAAYHRLVERAT